MNLLVPGKVVPRLLPSPTACSKSADILEQETQRHLKKIWLVMKLMVFLSLVCTLSLNAKTYSQQINVSFKDAELEKVFREIKKQTGYSFIYTLTMLEKGTKVTFKVKNASLQQALDECFRSQPFDYNIVDKNSDRKA
jgi:type II secretory pathway component GspD/PulD (secretin)